MAAEPPGCRPVPYCRRRPEQTALYQVVQQYLETYLTLAGEDDWDGQRVPAYVEREFRRYRECGILAYGFARARCPDCGHDFLVAFSCTGRGLCPSRNARRMAETAAHLVDHVFPPTAARTCASLPSSPMPPRSSGYSPPIGEPSRPPRIAPARGPPAWEDAPEPVPDGDCFGQPEPDCAFDQSLAW
jgi:hypothetical protein